MSWEYKTIKLVSNLKKNMLDVPHLDEKLNAMSHEGWELVTYTSYVKMSWFFGVSDDSGYIIATFKKPKSPS